MIKVRGNPALHFFDRYVGIPAVALAGRLRRQRSLPSEINKIGLLKGGAIGDTVLLSGIIADLRDAFPRAELTLFAGESNYEMATLLGGLNRVVKVPAARPLKGFRAIRSVVVDVLLDFGQWTRLEALFSMASKATFTIGFHTADQHRHHGFDLAVDHCFSNHELENYRALVSVLGVKASHLPSLPVPAHASSIGMPYIVCHLWPGGRRRELKQWPPDRWLRLITDFCNQGLTVVLTGGNSDRAPNRSLIDRLPKSACMRMRNAAGGSLSESLGLLASAQLVVSVDTGIMHIASALGVPLVALHGPTSSARWGPLNPQSIAIDTPLPEGGFINLGWEEMSPEPLCMEAISYEVVRDACNSLLHQANGFSRMRKEEEPAAIINSAANT